jgi:hypothetical protein
VPVSRKQLMFKIQVSGQIVESEGRNYVRRLWKEGLWLCVSIVFL